MTERLTVEMVDDYIARERIDDMETIEFFRLRQALTSPALIRAALVERDDARAQVAALTQALETAQARIDALVSERDNALEVVEAASKESAK